MVNFTKSQREAIDLRGKNLLVSAAAGSGKTAVLVERILKMITDPVNPVAIDRLLVVTFTEAAALEMRQRISRSIYQGLEITPDDRNLRRQASLLSKASISTIHSFCNRVVRDNFHILGIDPSYRIGDTAELSIIREEILEGIFAEEYEKEDNEIFFDLIEVFSDRFTDEKLRGLVLKIYEFSNNSTDPKLWLENCVNNFRLEGTVEESPWFITIRESVIRRLDNMIASARRAMNICRKDSGPVKYIDSLQGDIVTLEKLLKDCESFESMYLGFKGAKLDRLSSIKAKTALEEELKEAVKAIRDRDIKKELGNIQNRFFFKAPVRQADDISALYPYVLKLVDMVSRFREEYFSIKVQKNILDFNDLEHLCLKALNVDMAAREKIQEQYAEIFIDEYQDSNDIQEKILSLASRGENRFMVGDLKQSIYKFRRAKPEIFKEKYRTFGKDDKSAKIDLSENFRSRRGVISGINEIFQQIMTLEVGDTDYSPAERLNYGASYQETTEPEQVEIHVLHTDEEEDEENESIEQISEAERETLLIGRRIGELRCQWEYKDMAILVRSLKNAGILAEGLNKMGIPVSTQSRGGYFQNVEVMIILDFLRIIDNPMQDIPLVSILHSPIYGLSAGQLWEIRRALPKGSYYKALETFDKGGGTGDTYIKVRSFLADLKYFREISKFTPVSRLMDKLYEKTGYFYYVGAMSGGEGRQDNLRILSGYAAKFEETSLKGLFSFVRYIEGVMEKDGDKTASSSLEQGENAVKIMTIHKSKGLEFPVVFLAFAGGKFNLYDEAQDILLHEELGFGPKYVDLKLRVKSDTLPRRALAERIHKENFSEELRVLYVALTRAREKLIITGSVGKLPIDKWEQFLEHNDLKLPAQYILNCINYLDMVMPAVIRRKAGFDVKFHKPSEVKGFADEIVEEAIDFSLPEPLPEVLEEIDKMFSWRYSHYEDTILPTKITISEIKRNYYSRKSHEIGEEEPQFLTASFDMPEFLKRDRPLTQAEKGAAIHTLMEHIDMNCKTAEEVNQTISRLMEKNILSEKEGFSIPVDKTVKFLNSELARRIRESSYLKRETPFVMSLPAKEAYIQGGGDLLVHGIIDLSFEEDGELVLVDFKSDYVKDILEVMEKYRIQLSIYKKALEAGMNKKVKEAALYLFSIDDFAVFSDI